MTERAVEMTKAEMHAAKALQERYMRATKSREKGLAAVDVYVSGTRAGDRPLVVFHHIKKTAGTALRLVIFANHQEDEYVLGKLQRDEDSHEWWSDFYASFEQRDRLVCVAGHDAGFLLATVADRPVQALTLVREPVDLVLSRYYFLLSHDPQRWTLEALFDALDDGAATSHSLRVQHLCNGQSRNILAPHHDPRALPLLAGEPESDLWRERLLEIVDEHYTVGVQEHFADSVDLFAERFGWNYRYVRPLRVNRARPPRQELAPRTAEQIRRFNWLDVELHDYALRKLAACGRSLRGRVTTRVAKKTHGDAGSAGG